MAPEARVERYEEGRRVLDQQGDPDVEAADREEVEPLHEREARDPEEGEECQLLPTDGETRSRGHEQQQGKAGKRAGRARLCELYGREGVLANDLRDNPVECPEERRGRRHRVAEAWVAHARERDREGRFGHEAARYWDRLAVRAATE